MAVRSGAFRLRVLVGTHHYEDRWVERAALAHIRSVDAEELHGTDPGFLCVVVFRDATRLVCEGTPRELADRIWPAPPACSSCGKPL